jgi:hypothetical protein
MMEAGCMEKLAKMSAVKKFEYFNQERIGLLSKGALSLKITLCSHFANILFPKN